MKYFSELNVSIIDILNIIDETVIPVSDCSDTYYNYFLVDRLR